MTKFLSAIVQRRTSGDRGIDYQPVAVTPEALAAITTDEAALVRVMEETHLRVSGIPLYTTRPTIVAADDLHLLAVAFPRSGGDDEPTIAIQRAREAMFRLTPPQEVCPRYRETEERCGSLHLTCEGWFPRWAATCDHIDRAVRDVPTRSPS